MSRVLRTYLLACIALAFGYLVVHAGDPIRLDVGDAWTDASILTSIHHGGRASLAELLYGAVGSVVGDDRLVVFRSVALAFSVVAVWFLFLWARLVWNDTVAIVAAALVATSLVWMQFADSLDRPPPMHAGCFFALWAVARVVDSGKRRYVAAAFAGTVLCLVVGSSDWLFLPLAILFTLYVKRDAPFAARSWHVVAVCAFAAVLAFVLHSPSATSASEWRATLDHRVSSAYATVIRRCTALVSPMLWVAGVWSVWRAVRAPSVRAAIEDGTTWLLVAVIVFACLPQPGPESVELHAQFVLAPYAIGTALLVRRWLEGGVALRALAALSCVIATMWGGWLMVTYPRDVLDRDDLARANAYLAQNDRNSFVISNLLADGPMEAGFGRHGWARLYDKDASSSLAHMLELFEDTGTDCVHAVIFTRPASRFSLRSYTQATRHRSAALDGWPYLARKRVYDQIAAYDAVVASRLADVGAKVVLHLHNFDVYRIDRATVLDILGRSVPAAAQINFDDPTAARHLLLGWGQAEGATKASTVPSSVVGYGECSNPIASTATLPPNACTVFESPHGLEVADVGWRRRGDLMVRVDRVCDLALTVTLARPAPVDVLFANQRIHSCSVPQWATSTFTVLVPGRLVHLGINILGVEDVRRYDIPANSKESPPALKSVVIEPKCEVAP